MAVVVVVGGGGGEVQVYLCHCVFGGWSILQVLSMPDRCPSDGQVTNYPSQPIRGRDMACMALSRTLIGRDVEGILCTCGAFLL